MILWVKAFRLNITQNSGIESIYAVSYTHLDVYKRQILRRHQMWKRQIVSTFFYMQSTLPETHGVTKWLD